MPKPKCRVCGLPFLTPDECRVCGCRTPLAREVVQTPCPPTPRQTRREPVIHRRAPAPPPSARSCTNCGTAFTPAAAHAKDARFCSKPCRMETALAELNARYRARATPHEYTCEECSRVFTLVAVTHRLTGPKRRRFCTYQCKSRNQFRKLYATGGGRHFGYVGGKARVAVFERDGWRCQLCGAVVDRSLRFPSPGSITVDHIWPLGDGGPHEASNWQTAHLVCNIDKGNLDRKRKVA